MRLSKYNFSDFTESHYNLLLKTAKKNYTFESFGTKSVKSHIILRHDVDLSVHRALALAKLEKKSWKRRAKSKRPFLCTMDARSLYAKSGRKWRLDFNVL